MKRIPDPNVIFPNEYKTSCFVKNVITAPNISVGDYTYYDDPVPPWILSETTCFSTARSLGTVS